MKQISVILTDYTEECLNDILNKNICTISDIVNASIVAFSKEEQPPFIPDDSIYNTIVVRLNEKSQTVIEWCRNNNIDIQRLKYLCKRLDKGHSVGGLGNLKNKSRDRESGMIYKTHTAWIAQCLKDQLNLDFT